MTNPQPPLNIGIRGQGAGVRAETDSQSVASSRQPPNHQLPIINNQLSIINCLPLLILLLATFLRLYQLPSLPPGLNFDEAGNGVAALDILNGRPRLWWTIGGGKEPLWPYLIALSTAILGPVPLALRLPAALTGILTVAAVYPLMLALTRSRSAATLTMLGLALSGWHLHFSRLGFRAILFPLLATLAVYFFWHAFTRLTQHPPSPSLQSPVSNLPIPQSPISNLPIPTLLTSLFTALAIYAYLAARLLPLVFILFGLLYLLLTRRHFRPVLTLLSTFCILISIFLFPLIIHFIRFPADFLARSSAVSIFNPAWNNGDLLGTAWHTLTLTLSTFLGLHGDPNPLVNLPLQPAIPLFLAPFLLLGLATALYHTLKLPNPRHQLSIVNYQLSIASLLLLTWWLTMFLPALLAPEGAPHHLRLLGTIVPTYALIALGVITATTLLTRLIQPKPSNSQLSIINYQLSIVSLLLYTALAIHTSTAYFSRWPAAADFTLPFDRYAGQLATTIAQAPPGTTYILPMDIRAAAEARHYTIDYLLAGQPDAPYRYIPVDEANAEQGLTQAAQDSNTLRVVRWTNDKHREADAKEIVTYLLETNGQQTGRESYPVYDVERYSLTSPPPFSLPAIDQPVGATFADRLRLDAATLPPQAAPGDLLPVALTLAPLAPMETDYKASLRLIAPTGAQVAQKDRQLLHNFHQGTSLWPPETVNEYYLLPIPPDSPPGDYTVAVVIYHPATLAPLIAAGQAEVPLGTIRIEP